MSIMVRSRRSSRWSTRAADRPPRAGTRGRLLRRQLDDRRSPSTRAHSFEQACPRGHTAYAPSGAPARIRAIAGPPRAAPSRLVTADEPGYRAGVRIVNIDREPLHTLAYLDAAPRGGSQTRELPLLR